MRTVATASHLRAAEEKVFSEQPGVDLMSRAADAIVSVARVIAPSGPVVVAVGPGNNGGDGLYAAAALAGDRDVLVWLAMGTGHEAGLHAADEAGCRQVDAAEATESLTDASLVIDAVLGIGGRAGLPEHLAMFVDAVDALGVPVLAVDLPSGLDTDSGAAHPSFRADCTVTFAAPKPCHVVGEASERCGDLVVVDIGVPVPDTGVFVAEESDVARWWPVPGPDSHKYTRGVVGLDTGSSHYPGAALLGCAGALHAGPGMVRYLGGAPQGLVVSRFPSVVMADGRVQAMVLGSGWGDLEDAAERLAGALSRGVPLVLDADALSLLPADLPPGSLLTPHAGELARMLGVQRHEVDADPMGKAREAASRFGATVLLKGGTQYVATPSGTVTIAVRGPAWTGQAGSGDTLAGACGTLLAAGLEADRAAILGASLQAITASRHPGPHPPDVLASFFPDVIADLVDVADLR
ncbi:NAD(P)H-hydrate epimerase [Tessaracoccus antarcticus]|uniref:Bifunctional NAD(P)H-hydrate repair enzyme n=1 Tax=Tessaracoccus antarcticus TaxID=2479848 RepID=A0A3M0G0A2_9ACTN|nr:NAD(P)H-hydrate epimerase [Tessaracoccus antarcticus]RMB58354.1 NAD(P)H-hydrate epimerase [Tessaracoccus antarcticus]